MTRNHIPVVVDEYLCLPDAMGSATQTVRVGSEAWYTWLTNELHQSFSFKHRDGTFTARQERQRNGWYWYAYRKRAGQVHKTYLGRPKEVTPQRLIHAASILAYKEVQRQHKQMDISSAQETIHPILGNKFSVPISAIQPIERPHLLKRITEGVKGKLVLLSAAAGWGKTTLLSSWCTDTHNMQVTAWVSLDAHDNEPIEFWTHVLTALNIVQTGSFEDALARLRETQTLHSVLKTFLNTCQNSMTDIVLILDNYDTIQSPEIHQTLTFLLEHVPTKLHLIIATRTKPPFRLARLRVQGTLTEFHNADLRFTDSETNLFLQKMQGMALSHHECNLITEKTEGWIAGIQLFSLQIKEHGFPLKTDESSLSSNCYLLDYINEEILLKQVDELQQFMLQTSVLEDLNASLCDTLREKDDSQHWIEQLSNMNLVRAEGQENGYCYPKPLRDTLYYQLQRTQPFLRIELQQRAQDWYMQQDQLTMDNEIARSENSRTAANGAVHPTLPAQPTTLRVQSNNSPDAMLFVAAHATKQQRPMSAYLTDTLPEKLTKREYDVLQLLISGASNRDIAQNLILSEGTVKKHVSNICNKLGVQSRTQAMAKSISLAII